MATKEQLAVAMFGTPYDGLSTTERAKVDNWKNPTDTPTLQQSLDNIQATAVDVCKRRETNR